MESLHPTRRQSPVPARVCVIRKSQAAIALAHKKLRRRASRTGTQLKPETFFYAQYVIVLTTFPGQNFPAELILEWYRFRWQIELVFKRFKQIVQLGICPSMMRRVLKPGSMENCLSPCSPKNSSTMPAPFPPGATSWKSQLSRSRWREFSFAFRQLSRVIQPALSLRQMIDNWPDIVRDLADPPRKRKSQEEKFFDTLKTS